MSIKAEAIAPLIRGLTYNGETGATVTFSPERKSGPGVLSVKDAEAFFENPGTAYSEYLLVNKNIPEAVSVEGLGSFAVSTALRDGWPSVLAGKIAVVTGGAQGFGAGIVEQLVKKDIFVFVADMNLKGAQEFAAQTNKSIGRECCDAVEVNVADEASVEQMMNTIALKKGGIDIFINNAGVLKAGSVKEMNLGDFEFVTKVNYTGYFICTKFASRLMAEQNRGAESIGKNYYSDVIQINSKSGLEGSNKNGAYAGGKFGGIGLTQSFALELISDNIKVNSICPGNFFEGPLWSDPERGLFVQYLNAGKVPGAKTIADVKEFYEAKVPMGRGCNPVDVSKAVFYLVEQKYETGQALPVTGGQIMLK